MICMEPPPGRTTVSAADTGADDLYVQQLELVVVEGPDTGRSFVSRGDRVAIGKHESVDFELHDESVSRIHAELAIVEGRVVVRDLGSRNGTLIDGVRIQIGFPANGAIITVGNSKLRLVAGDQRNRVPLSDQTRFGVMVGCSQAMRRVFAILERASKSDATVLLAGETGTGKEAAAESIHRESERRDGPLIVVECGTIPSDLLESELFGHERGAFTGAVSARQGAFEAARGGTIFLDEIGELSPDLQPKLLRALERREIKAVGSNHHHKVDVRVISATNVDLEEAVNARRFRADLYYRLAVIQVRLPALRERRDDLPQLVPQLLAQLGLADRPEAARVLSDELLREMARHAWPGNVRELRNYIERVVALDLPLELVGPGVPHPGVDRPFKDARDALLRDFERRYVDHLLHVHRDNVSAAARAAGLDRLTFYRMLWRHGLR
jgi:two-component system, NtrC family, response regulator GlrR